MPNKYADKPKTRPAKQGDNAPIALVTKGARAREALLDGGLALLAALSPRDLTPGTICTAAQMKRPSFYTYFDSVDDLLDAIAQREIARLETLYEAENNTDQSALHRLAGISLNLVTQTSREPERTKAFVKLIASQPAFAQMRLTNLRRDIEACIDEGSLKLARAQIDIYMQIYVAGILSLISGQAETALSRQDIAHALDILLRGAGADGDALQAVLGTAKRGKGA